MKKDKNIKASVILPVHNAEKYLNSAIDSILNQTFKNFELLLLNDGSNDNSEQIIDSYVSRDRRCKKFSWSNKGLIKTLNIGIEQSVGEIIFRMDADDISYPDRFEKQILYLEQHPDCVAVGSRVLLIDDESLPIRVLDVPTEHEDIDKENLKGAGASIVHPTAAIRKKALLKVNGYRESYPHAEDIDLFLRLAELGDLANMVDILLSYRQHVSSVGYSKRKEQLDSILKAIKDANFRRGLFNDVNIQNNINHSPGLYDVYIKWSWWALRAGNKKTAWKYLLKAVSLEPFHMRNLNLLMCNLRGR
ncbi:hypothetical protein GCM10025856_23570 [Methylophaga marina]|uniref:Glycosyltransferase 2-like domain-containing protein n=1 Tax=Methylophaga marina TaxID=45495 RepID=A0ABP3D902_9GAMM|nr:glycosyltransferase family 2 protein [Methylophaga marina]BDZ74638.1 hypothetical protein GCM10025856_23570 [Methylophaga marina]